MIDILLFEILFKSRGAGVYFRFTGQILPCASLNIPGSSFVNSSGEKRMCVRFAYDEF
jgi:hypothetical protein